MNLKKYATIVILLASLLVILLIFELPSNEITFEKIVGGNKNDEGWYIVVDSEEVIVLGYTESYDPDSSDIWLLKFDKNGNEKWNKTFGGIRDEKGKAIEKIPEGYIIVGGTYSYGYGDSDVWVIKIDRNGSEIWNRTYGGEGKDIGRAILSVYNGYILVGETTSYGSGNSDFWLIKIDNNGNELWNKTYGGVEYDEGRYIDYADDGYILAGGTRSYSLGEEDVWVIMVDERGNEIWNKTFGTSEMIEYANQVIKTKEGEFVLVGHSISTNYTTLNGIIAKIDKEGKVKWELIENDNPTGLSSVVETEEGYLAIGYKGSYISGEQDLLMVLVDVSGNKKWSKTIGERDITDAGVWVDYKDNICFIAGYKERSRDKEGNPVLDLWLVGLRT